MIPARTLAAFFAVHSAFLVFHSEHREEPAFVQPVLHQEAATPRVSFHFQRPEAAIKDWSIDWPATGEITYREGTTALPLQLSVSTRAVLLAGRYVVAQHRCETREKHIAQTGRKEITYTNATGTIACTFNYSDDDVLNHSASTFIAIAETVQIGDELARRRRFDRLGIDAELDLLLDELQSGRALEGQNIAPTLKSIAEDDRIMERARRKAAHVLESLPKKAAETTQP